MMMATLATRTVAEMLMTRGEDNLTEDNDAAESVHLKEGKDAPIWGWLGTSVSDRSTTDTETGETTKMMK